jgi:hypothetical protein
MHRAEQELVLVLAADLAGVSQPEKIELIVSRSLSDIGGDGRRP